MSDIVFSPLAESDLAEILDYIAQDNPSAAIKFLGEIRTKMYLYSQNPELGKRADHLSNGSRYFVKGNYLIFYRLLSGRFEIIRILHGAQNLPDLF